MDEQEWTTRLAELRYMDQMAAEMFAEAARRFEDDPGADTLQRLRAQHERHTQLIDDVFFEDRAHGPEGIPDEFKREMEHQLAAVGSARSKVDALRALLAAEEQHRERYASAAVMRMPTDAGRLVLDDLADERAHVDILQRRVDETEPPGRGGEPGPAAGR